MGVVVSGAESASSGGSTGAGWRNGESAAEALRLFEAVQDWARRSSLGDLGAHLGRDPEGGFATGSRECTLCPICQVVGVVREHHPEVAEHLTDAVTSLAAAVRSALAGSEAAGSGGSNGSTAASETSSTVQHIDIG
jgi:hypothetical protein